LKKFKVIWKILKNIIENFFIKKLFFLFLFSQTKKKYMMRYKFLKIFVSRVQGFRLRQCQIDLKTGDILLSCSIMKLWNNLNRDNKIIIRIYILLYRILIFLKIFLTTKEKVMKVYARNDGGSTKRQRLQY